MRVALTFDDGYKSHFTVVRPLLLEKQMTGTFFICSGLLGHPNMLTAIEAKSLQDNFELGSHTHKHSNLTLPYVSLKSELTVTEQIFAQHQLKKPTTFAYPGFHVSQRLVREFQQTNYQFARAGCENTSDFMSFQKGGAGTNFNYLCGNPYNVNCTGIFGEQFRYDEFVKALDRLTPNEVAVFCFHDIVANTQKVNLSIKEFEKCIEYLSTNNYATIQFQDLSKPVADVKINYVIAAWSGERQDKYGRYQEDRCYYLKQHLASLKRLDHSLIQITIVAPFNDHEPASFTEFLKQIPSQIQNTKVVVLRRENGGQSYGSYNHAYQTFKDKFDYYIFIEDDYIFVKDNFDSILQKHFDQEENCGFLCSYATHYQNHFHAAISNGITSTRVLDRIHQHFNLGRLPCGIKYQSYEAIPQLRFSEGFLGIGTKICDLTKYYRAAFNKINTLVFFGDNSKEDLIYPLQFLDVIPAY